MVSFTWKVRDPLGLHAKTAGLLVREALKCSSEVRLKKDEKEGNAKLIFHVMTLNVHEGDEVEVMVSGEHEAEEAAALKEFYQENI